MSEKRVDARPLTSVELLDAAVWREIGSEEAQLQSAFIEALSSLSSNAPQWVLGPIASPFSMASRPRLSVAASNGPTSGFGRWLMAMPQ